MNIRNISDLIRKKHNGISFYKKLLLFYLLCSLAPMLLSIGVYYHSMEKILMKDAYETVGESMRTMQNSLEHTLQPYQTLMGILKNDQSLHIQLNMDYSSTPYADLADYTRTSLDTMMAMYPDLKAVRFYCSNPTLPADECHFFQKEELDADLIGRLEQTVSGMLLCRDPEDSGSFVLVSKMNYYTSGTESNYLVFRINGELIENILAVDAEREALLLDSTGKVLLTEHPSVQCDRISDYLPSYDSLTAGNLKSIQAEDGKNYICLASDAGLNLQLLILRDQETVLQNVRSLPLRLINLVIALLAVNSLLALFIGKHQNRRLKKIQNGIHAIGSGRFDEKIEDLGEDELGQIASQVDHLGTRLDQLIRENYRKQLTIKSSELNLLQEQINPHFLYNALAVISSLALQENGKRTVQSIRYLADFYRISLNKGRKVIHVREEIDLLVNYMKIQLLRFSDLVEIDYQVEPEVEEYYTIKLLLQPLVENAIHHAREEEAFLSIHVLAYEKGDRICFDVADNGMGIPPEELEKLQQELQRQEEGFGLKNVDKRIKLAYGQEYGVTVFSVRGEGTRIHLEIPKVKERELS